MAKKKTPKKSGKKHKKSQKDKKPEDYNAILRNFLIGVGILVLIIIIGYFIVQSLYSFELEGVDFKVMAENDLVLYNTKLPVVFEGQKAEYNFFLRKDPRKTYSEVPFEGSLDLKKIVVLNSTSDFNCDGFGIIATANLVKQYEVLGSTVLSDKNATCDAQERYMHINIVQSEDNETKVVETSDSCYQININQCEILEGTERFMIETFIEVQPFL